ncbi:IclR family transcriptional regulator [Moorella sp. E308F]|uniref:IclR family transcriptional regulator n=1 Tax=Moorella sp. E308F TaxID=2572682 RepID=UPI0010FFAA6C|nr:IclR family transcriptional regulator [Moorella sp. E308F]GEA15590.1 IclR family transcriptional regulator [Moorella sp. E308F]
MAREKNNAEESKTVQAVERALAIMDALAEAGVPMAISDLADKVQLNISTVHRLLSTLIVKGYIEQEPETSRYKLGLKLFAMGKTALYAQDLQTIGRPFLEELVRRCNETANLAILDDRDVVYIDQVESNNIVIVRMFARVGSRGPAHATGSGKMLLSSLTDEELDKLFAGVQLEQYTSETITDVAILKKELQRIRRQGYAIDLGERDENVRCVAAPIRNHEGKVVAAISVSGPDTRITNYYLNNELVDIVLSVAREMSKRLGYAGNDLK